LQLYNNVLWSVTTGFFIKFWHGKGEFEWC